VSQPDLFVVCKNCGSEVSPYVTECPYCGQRVRKRAPKLDRGAAQVQPKRRARRLPRLRADEIAGIAPDTRPYATLGILAVCAALLLVFAADDKLDLGFIVVGPDAFGGASEEVWRWFTTSFFHGDQLGYAFVALVPVAIFGTLLERRFGPLPVLAIFVLGGAAGAGLAVVLETPPLFEDPAFYSVFGANGAALALLCAWLVDDRRAARRGDERDNDLIGVYVIAVVLVLLSLTTEEANIACAVGGALLGAVFGLILPAFTRKGAT
jgi:membrane associated rhomboid family serine protease